MVHAESARMIGSRDDDLFGLRSHRGEHTGNVLILRCAEDKIDHFAWEILFQRLAQLLERILVMGGVKDDGWIEPRNLEAGAPLYLRKPFLDLFISYWYPADLQSSICSRGIFELMFPK